MNKVKQSKFVEWCKVGTTHQTNFNGECEVVTYRSSTDIDVMFKDGTIVNTKSGNLKKGVVDKIRKRLGYKTSYRTQEEALFVYKECKKVQLKDLAEKYKGKIDNRVYEKLVNYNFELENSD